MALWTAGVRDGNSAGLLSSVLQGGKAIVDRRTDVGTIQIVNAENTTFLPDVLPGLGKDPLTEGPSARPFST